ncbi:MAG: hypothetical protein KF914_13615 [Rhizobiaceae bacterium]|nr:hypothetical protein [Rhizobiaceae bacterium]
MSGVFAILVRFVVITLGFAAAALAASAFLHLLFLGAQHWPADRLPGMVSGSLIFSIPFAALFIAYFAILPAAVVIVVAELLGRRDWLTYALGGGLVGLAVAAFFWQAAGPVAGGVELDPAAADPIVADPAFAAVLIGGGIAAGLAYWLVAGRSAGSWRPPGDDAV